MPLADFLTQVGGRTAVGQVGRIFGGQTDREKVMAQFVNTELPALTKQLEGTTDRAEGEKILGNIFKAAVSAGVGPRSLERLQQTLAVPFARNMQRTELDSLLRDYGSRPAQPRPEGVEGPMTEAGNFIDPSQGRPRDLEFNIRATNAGIKPDDLGHFLQNPEDIRSKQLGNQKTEQNIQHEQAKEQEINKLSTEPGPAGISQQRAARLGLLPQVLPQRERPEDPLLEERRGLMEAQTQAALAQGTAATALATRRETDPVGPQARPLGPRDEITLGQQFNTESKPFEVVRDAYNSIKALSKNNTPASGIAMISAFVKMQDPRISDADFRNVKTAQPLLERYGLSGAKRLWEGKTLTDKQSADILNQTKAIYDSAARQQQQRADEYTRRANSYGLNPSRIVSDKFAVPEGQGRYSEGIPSGSAPAQQAGGQAPTEGESSVMRNKSKSGKPIVSTDGGKTWRYE